MRASVRPRGSTGRQSARECPRGSPVAITRKSAANATRPPAAPIGPMRSNTWNAITAANWLEIAETTTRPAAGSISGRAADRAGATAWVVIGRSA